MIRVLLLTAVTLVLACASEHGAGSSSQRPAAGASATSAAPALGADSVTRWFNQLQRQLAPLLAALDAARSQMIGDSGTAGADSVFVAFRRVYEARLDSIGARVSDDAWFQNWIMTGQTATDSAQRFLSARGLTLTWSEGSAYVTEDPGALLQRPGSFLTAPMQRFLHIRRREEGEGFAADGGLRITWDQVAARIATWEQFLAEYPSFVLHDEAQAWYDLYVHTYLTGMDNSRLYSFESGTLDGAVRHSYERFVAQHGNTPSGRLVRGMLDVLARTGFRDGPEVQAYLKSAGVGTALGVQPPTR